MLNSIQSENSHGAGKKIISVIVVIIAIAVIAFFFYKKGPSQENKTAEINTAVQSSVGGIEKTNPFKVDVNPYQGYKNPFQ